MTATVCVARGCEILVEDEHRSFCSAKCASRWRQDRRPAPRKHSEDVGPRNLASCHLAETAVPR
jgi:hypothetical protein